MSRSLRMYQHIAVAFVVITFLLLLCVLYLSVSRATIRVVADPKVIDVEARIDVVKDSPVESQVQGVVAETVIEKSRVFTLPSEGAKPVEGKASGYVTLINESAKEQPLVATTRLISQEGILFRLQNAVTVPAGGQVEAFVKADSAGRAGEIGASKFTIPGLNATLQTQIYGVSVAGMTGGVQYVRALSQADIDNAVDVLAGEILAEAKQTLSANADRNVLDGESYSLTTVSQSTDAAVGAEVGSFTLTLKQKVAAVYYPKVQVQNTAERLLSEQVPDGFQVSLVNRQTSRTEVEEIDIKNSTAGITVYLDGLSMISEDAQTLDKDRFVGRAPHEVITLLQASEAIQDVSVSFTPFWLKRVPTLQDHIKIIIEEPKQ
ncbi:MAG: hypothetical protein QG626_93 [Patescibacteria group bacterium]|nr:hypothetical protein [Patescibacteria group bacterium]